MVFIIMQEKKSQKYLIKMSFQNSERIKSSVPEWRGDDAQLPAH